VRPNGSFATSLILRSAVPDDVTADGVAARTSTDSFTGASVGLVLPSLSGAAVSKLPAQHYAVGSAVNQATRQIGAVIGVAITVLLLGHGVVERSDFNAVYGLHIGLALLTAALCVFVKTRPAPRPA